MDDEEKKITKYIRIGNDNDIEPGCGCWLMFIIALIILSNIVDKIIDALTKI